jgi:hypothetical protein
MQSTSQHVNFVVPVLTGLFGLLSALAGTAFASRAAAKRESVTRAETELREERNRQADEQRERLRDLRLVVDDATRALHDLWSITAAFSYAIPRANPKARNRSPVESREPDPRAFDQTYHRLVGASVRMQLRVARDDVLHAPVDRAVVACQDAFNAFMHQDPEGSRSREDEQRILKANAAASTGYRELLEAARERLAPGNLPGALRSFNVVFDVERRDKRLDEVMTSLQRLPELRWRVRGPTSNNVVMLRIDAETREDAEDRAKDLLIQVSPQWHELLTSRGGAD